MSIVAAVMPAAHEPVELREFREPTPEHRSEALAEVNQARVDAWAMRLPKALVRFN